MNVVVQLWEESERGWGVRPDGCSYHLTLKDQEVFVTKFYAKRGEEAVPAEYSRTQGRPFTVEIEDDSEIAKELKASEHGIWSRDRPTR